MTADASEPAVSPTGATPVILVVEDEEMVGEVVRAMLKMGGFDSVHAKGGEEALRILEDPAQHFDLVLTDNRMPFMTGIEFIQHVRALRPSLKSVLYSGNADPCETRAYPVQPHRFLRKPFTPATLNNLVREVLAG